MHFRLRNPDSLQRRVTINEWVVGNELEARGDGGIGRVQVESVAAMDGHLKERTVWCGSGCDRTGNEGFILLVWTQRMNGD